MIKKLLITLSILLLATPLMAQDMSYDGLARAELLATPQGRYVAVSDSVVMTIWYNGSGGSPTIGVSSATGDIYFRAGGAKPTIAQIDENSFLNVSETTGDTVGEVVDYINLETTGAWHAIEGPDATRGTAIGWDAQMFNGINVTTPGRSESGGTQITLNTPEVNYMTVGVSGHDGDVARITQFEASGDADLEQGLLEIWDDSGQLWGRNYEFPVCTPEISPTTVEFQEPGLGGDWGENIVAVLAVMPGVNLTSDTTNEATGNVSIIYNVLETE